MTVEQLLEWMSKNDCSLSMYKDKLDGVMRLRISGDIEGKVFQTENRIPLEEVKFPKFNTFTERLDTLIRIFTNEVESSEISPVVRPSVG